jgi:hypothetical protein
MEPNLTTKLYRTIMKLDKLLQILKGKEEYDDDASRITANAVSTRRAEDPYIVTCQWYESILVDYI